MKLFNATAVEDLIVKADSSNGKECVAGVVTNWTLVSLSKAFVTANFMYLTNKISLSIQLICPVISRNFSNPKHTPNMNIKVIILAVQIMILKAVWILAL